MTAVDVDPKLRLAAIRAFKEHDLFFRYPHPEAHPNVVSLPAGLVALVNAIPFPDWGFHFSEPHFVNLAADDGFMLNYEAVKAPLRLGGGFGNWTEDPISGGLYGNAWVAILTTRGTLAQARVTTLLHLAEEVGWKLDTGQIAVPRRGVFAPYAPDKGGNWDKRLFPEVVKTLRALSPIKIQESVHV
jgi:hypothetical protein